MPSTPSNISASAHAAVPRPLRIAVEVAHAVVLILSLLLIVYISYDTFNNIPFLSNHTYMTFQFWVCVVFMADFFLELATARERRYYLKVRWLFLVISIPYLNIINQFNIHFPEQVLFYLRFIPLLRGAYALATVVGYVSHNRAVSLLSQYVAILFVFIYSLSLMFYYEEHGINPNVATFWDALYFSCMSAVTVGCYFNAVTTVGKVISVILPMAGLLIIPLFTVAVTSRVQAYDVTRRRLQGLFRRDDNPSEPPKSDN